MMANPKAWDIKEWPQMTPPSKNPLLAHPVIPIQTCPNPLPSSVFQFPLVPLENIDPPPAKSLSPSNRSFPKFNFDSTFYVARIQLKNKLVNLQEKMDGLGVQIDIPMSILDRCTTENELELVKSMLYHFLHIKAGSLD
jgi:hypothetical protein